nr:hypothetical protein [Tanacetum cinerariifolium]
MPLLPYMLLQAQAGAGAEVAEQAIPHHMPAPDQFLAHLPTPSRPQTSKPVAPVLEHNHSFDPHETAGGSFLTREDAPLGDDFHTSPPRSSKAPPAGQPSGGEEDLITLTALSSVVSTLVHKVHSLEAELHDHKRLFKDVVRNLSSSICLNVLALTGMSSSTMGDLPLLETPAGTFGLSAGTAEAAVRAIEVLGRIVEAPVVASEAPGGIAEVAGGTPEVSGGPAVGKLRLATRIYEVLPEGISELAATATLAKAWMEWVLQETLAF